MRPAWVLTRRCKSSGDLVAGTQANRKVLAREGDAEGSGERTREPTNRNRIRGGGAQGERANDREALCDQGARP